MKTTYVSTSAISNVLRSTVLKAQEQLISANKEMTTGRYADIGVSIGSRTGLTVNVRSQYDRIEGILDTNGLISQRLDTSQEALGSMLSVAQNFMATLLAVRNGEKGAEVLVTEATHALQTMTGAANTAVGNQFVFGGINTQQQPMTDYFSTLPPPAAPGTPAANKAAIDTAFAAAFPVATYPTIADIPAADLTTFLQGAFATEFADPAWGTNWSSASSRNLTGRISPNEVMTVSTNANEPFMRDLAKAYTMIVGLPTADMSQNTYEALVGEALATVSNAVQGLIKTQAQLGSAQSRVSTASDRLGIQRDILSKQIQGLEGVDPYEAKLRVDQLTTQVETSYALTVKFQSLSILNYMR
jgi:flagellar hook-associated protein 3 FlgL